MDHRLSTYALVLLIGMMLMVFTISALSSGEIDESFCDEEGKILKRNATDWYCSDDDINLNEGLELWLAFGNRGLYPTRYNTNESIYEGTVEIKYDVGEFHKQPDDAVNLSGLDIVALDSGNFTISMWYRSEYVYDKSYVFQKGHHTNNNSFDMYFEDAQTMKFWTHHGGEGVDYCVSVIKEFSLEPHIWHHFVAMYNGTMNFFINNNEPDYLFNSGNCENFPRYGNGETTYWVGNIGSYNQSFNGSIDDLRFYSRAIDQDEIAILYNMNPKTSAHFNSVTIGNTRIEGTNISDQVKVVETDADMFNMPQGTLNVTRVSTGYIDTDYWYPYNDLTNYVIHNDDTVRPSNNGVKSLGGTSFRWRNLHLGNGTLTTSDSGTTLTTMREGQDNIISHGAESDKNVYLLLGNTNDANNEFFIKSDPDANRADMGLGGGTDWQFYTWQSIMYNTLKYDPITANDDGIHLGFAGDGDGVYCQMDGTDDDDDMRCINAEIWMDGGRADDTDLRVVNMLIKEFDQEKGDPNYIYGTHMSDVGVSIGDTDSYEIYGHYANIQGNYGSNKHYDYYGEGDRAFFGEEAIEMDNLPKKSPASDDMYVCWDNTDGSLFLNETGCS